VPGHEYVGEVIDYGPGSKRTVKTGRRVTSIPIMRQSGATSIIGFHNDFVQKPRRASAPTNVLNPVSKLLATFFPG